MIMEEILAAQGLKSPARRDPSIAGVKVLALGEGENRLHLDGLRDHGVVYARQLARTWHLAFGDVDPGMMAVTAPFLEDLQRLLDWKKQGPSVPIYEPGPIASQTALSQITGFADNRDEFVWTKRRRRHAIQLHDNHRTSDDYIASQLGCTIDDVVEFFRGRKPGMDVAMAGMSE
jgi:hypothetical protein